MRQILLYQLRLGLHSRWGWIASGLTLAVFVVLLNLPVVEGISRIQMTLQGLLLTVWLVELLVIPVLASQAAEQTQNSGQLEWWYSSGTATWKIVVSRVMGLLTWWLIYLVGVVTPLVAYLNYKGNIGSWPLWFEFLGLSLASAFLLLLFTWAGVGIAGATFGCGLSIINVSVSLTIAGGIPALISEIPRPWVVLVSWVWYLLPRFELFYRPLSLVYQWPLLSSATWFSLLCYTIGYGLALVVISHQLYRPRYA